VTLKNAASDLKRLVSGGLREQVFLNEYVTYQIGGPADLCFTPATESDLIKALEYVHKSGISFFILGSGSNLLIDDVGFRGIVFNLGPTVLTTDTTKYQVISETSEHICVRVPAWYSKAKLLVDSLERSWAGLEFSAGIPGTLGGAVFMNAGTKWGAYADVIESVRLFHVEQGLVERSVSEMGFKYRGHGESSLGKEAIVLSVDLKLRKSQEMSSSKNLVQEILSYRGEKQPLERPNCGSVFKNPENSERGAGRLIEACGLKGKQIGGGMFSDKHANFILNIEKATSDDIKGLIALAQDEVFKKHSINLEREVIYV
jgi:UDP-N-acetylmuramate dehydrogenase